MALRNVPRSIRRINIKLVQKKRCTKTEKTKKNESRKWIWWNQDKKRKAKSHGGGGNVLPFLYLHKLWIFHQHMSISSNCYSRVSICSFQQQHERILLKEKIWNEHLHAREKKTRLDSKEKFHEFMHKSIFQVWICCLLFSGEESHQGIPFSVTIVVKKIYVSAFDTQLKLKKLMDWLNCLRKKFSVLDCCKKHLEQ